MLRKITLEMVSYWKKILNPPFKEVNLLFYQPLPFLGKTWTLFLGKFQKRSSFPLYKGAFKL